MKRRLLSMLLIGAMLLATLPHGNVVFAQENCVSVLPSAPATGTVSAGGLYELKLNTVFADSEGHSLTFSFTSEVQNQHTKIRNGSFFFSCKQEGTYEVVLTATCGTSEVSHKLTITVGKANEGIDAQYGYDETNKESVTVYVTISNDGCPLMAGDGTILSHLAVTVPYFDLGLYGLEEFYRYGTDGGKGIYTTDTIIQRPTGLHLYIYLLERYYIGLEESECCKGLASGVLQFTDDTEVYYMDGEIAYESAGKSALMTSGGATSIYMVNFWGHDENLMYYRNHCYPYMSAGWGSTSDYILLSDGDTWDVAMFTNWNFYHTGYFASFSKDAYFTLPGSDVTVSTQKWGTSAEAADFEGVNELSVGLYNSEWELIEELPYDSEDGNTITFTAPKEAGTYYVMATDPNVKDPVEAKIAPATARIVVRDGNINEDNIVDMADISSLLQIINGTDLQLTEEQKKMIDITGDGVINMADVTLLLEYIKKTMPNNYSHSY